MGEIPKPSSPSAAGPCVLVIFGVTGDLTKRLLFPALYNLRRQHLLPEQFSIAGFALSDLDEEGLGSRLTADMQQQLGSDADAATIRWLTSRLHFIGSDFDSPDGWARLKTTLAETDNTHGTGGNYLFYM